MQPLIDGDILLHEIGWSGEFKDKETGEAVLLPFERVAEILDDKIRLICEDVDATLPPIIFISDSEQVCKMHNRCRKLEGLEPIEFIPNFRYDVAKTKPYKGNRKNPKPFHFYNIIAYLMYKYDVVVSEDGYEADDMMCIEQKVRLGETIICTRDKDLRICPGWHFSWECGKQKAIGPVYTDRLGNLVAEVNEQGKVIKRYGYGMKFFYYQMLAGDSADNIPGLPKYGEVKAFNLLDPIDNEWEIYKAVQAAYIEIIGDNAKEYFMEQANLLWMTQEKGKGYETPKTKCSPVRHYADSPCTSG